jgi:hypothetical protein
MECQAMNISKLLHPEGIPIKIVILSGVSRSFIARGAVEGPAVYSKWHPLNSIRSKPHFHPDCLLRRYTFASVCAAGQA